MGLKRIVSSFSGDPRGFAKYLLLTHRPGVSSESPIFVVGPPRSGTTMLYTRLTAYDRFCGPRKETGFFMIVNPYRIPMDPLPNADWKRFVEESKTQTQLLDRAIGWFKVNFGADLFVEKTPQHCLHYRRIFRAWPNGRILAIVRHPLDCVASALRNKDVIPQGSDIERAACYWKKCAAAVNRLREDERSKVVRYEDVATGQVDVVDLVRFVSGDDRRARVSREIDHAYVGKKGFELLDAPIQPTRIGTWRDVLSVEQVRKIWGITARVASTYGYTLV